MISDFLDSSFATGVIGIIGVLLGVVVERWLRRRGGVRREISAWMGGAYGSGPEHRTFEVRFFNDKDVDIALWDLVAEFYQGQQLIDALPPQQLMNFLLPREAQEVNPPDGPIDLPSHRSVYIRMTVEADGELLEKLKRSDRGRFVAEIVPRGGQVDKPLPAWNDVE